MVVSVVIHPTQAAIVEAMLWLETAGLSERGRKDVRGARRPLPSAISYHRRSLAERGAVEKTGHRGAEEPFYFLSPAMTARANGGAR
jgi:hypothetical protein